MRRPTLDTVHISLCFCYYQRPTTVVFECKVLYKKSLDVVDHISACHATKRTTETALFAQYVNIWHSQADGLSIPPAALVLTSAQRQVHTTGQQPLPDTTASRQQWKSIPRLMWGFVNACEGTELCGSLKMTMLDHMAFDDCWGLSGPTGRLSDAFMETRC